MGNSSSTRSPTPPPSPSHNHGDIKKSPNISASAGHSSSSKSPNISPSASARYSSTQSRTSTTSTYASPQHITNGSSATTNTTYQGLYSSTSPPQSQPSTPREASQSVKISANNYVIPATTAIREHQNITACQVKFIAKLQVCPQDNGRGCVAEPCRRLHICYHWATKTCNKNTCKRDHCLDSPHNQRLLKACLWKQNVRNPEVSEIIIKQAGSLPRQEGPQICLYSVLKRCKREPCPNVHSARNYLWQVQDGNTWIQLSFNQSDYLEVMYSHPSEECVDLIPLKTPLPNIKSLKRLASLLSRQASWTADLEAMKLRGGSSVLDIRRLSTTSDITSHVPVAMRWLWYWQDDDGCWEPYREGVIDGYYYVALSDSLEFFLQTLNKLLVRVSIGSFCYSLDGKKMTQTNLTTGRVRSMRRRPACSTVSQESVRFDNLFLPLPASKRFLKVPVLPLSSEFIFVESLLKQTLTQVKVASIHRVQNDHLWRAYQNKKDLLTSLYGGDVAATNEQYLFHGTGLNAVNLICEENLDWKLSGTNVGCLYGSGTYFSNLASTAHQYAKSDKTGKRVMLVVLVVVGKMTRGNNKITLPPENTAFGRTYDTTCNSDIGATIFVKYNRDEYYPAYVVRYSCDIF